MSGARRVVTALLMAATSGCVQPDTAPDTPAAIEFEPFAWPSVVQGDVLRNERGDSVPLRAIVRNVSGETLADVPVRFLVPDSANRRRVRVDSLRGFVRGDSITVQPIRVIARASDELQAVSPAQGRPDGGIVVVPRPTRLQRSAGRTADTLIVAPTIDRDTTVGSITGNLSPNLPVILANTDSATARPVQRWIVRYAITRPANPTNDTTQTYFLVNRDGNPRRSSTEDTTDTQGEAGRALRARGTRVAAAVETVTVEARATYRGQPVTGSPFRFQVLVRRP
ncbi:MAG: hypothetical protein MUF00_14295 [Gemmatimonadaceae bacterium]|jgi:hypothetical protein|nr:hypothetical protein [Gemmatimonadaceae bacterium]